MATVHIDDVRFASTVVVRDTEEQVAVVVEDKVSVVTVGVMGPPGVKGDKGDKGDQGDRGLPGAASHTYVHDQTVPLNVWVINHPMSKFPSVTCMDSAGDEIEGILSYDSLDRVTVTFGAATGGKAYLN